jgi:hypothetical protein
MAVARPDWVLMDLARTFTPQVLVRQPARDLGTWLLDRSTLRRKP